MSASGIRVRVRVRVRVTVTVTVTVRDSVRGDRIRIVIACISQGNGETGYDSG